MSQKKNTPWSVEEFQTFLSLVAEESVVVVLVFRFCAWLGAV